VLPPCRRLISLRLLDLSSPSSPEMPVVPLLCPAVACDTYNPASDTCFACDPPYRHRRVWIPDGPTPRTLVLCFDGTGDSFDNDVSQPSSISCLWPHETDSNVAFTEFKRRPIPGDAKERRPHEPACLLSGDPPLVTRKTPSSSCAPLQAGIGTYTNNVLKTPIIEAMSKKLDAMIAYDLPDHVKGLSFPPRVSCLTIPDESF